MKWTDTAREMHASGIDTLVIAKTLRKRPSDVKDAIASVSRSEAATARNLARRRKPRPFWYAEACRLRTEGDGMTFDEIAVAVGRARSSVIKACGHLKSPVDHRVIRAREAIQRKWADHVPAPRVRRYKAKGPMTKAKRVARLACLLGQDRGCRKPAPITLPKAFDARLFA